MAITKKKLDAKRKTVKKKTAQGKAAAKKKVKPSTAKGTKQSAATQALYDQLKTASEEGAIVLLLVKSEDYVRVNNDVLQYLLNKERLNGIYVTLNRPYSTLVNTLKARGIETDKLFFIDMITKSSGGTASDTENCLYVRSPENLTELSISLAEAVAVEKQSKKFIFLDSLSTLLIYNQAGTVTKFAHFLTSKMRLWGVSGVIVSLENETDTELKSQLTQFCDRVINIETGGKS